MIGMPKVTTGSNPVADKLLELFHLRKSLLYSTRPEDVGTDANFKDASGTWLQSDFPNLVLKGRQ